ncbi:MAG: hypothetical protein ABIQ88_19775 [Chitinophagaceae bacterium]
MECISQLPDKYDDIKIESVERVNEVRKLLVLSVETNSWKVSKSYFLTALHEFSHCIDRSIAVVQATERTLPSITTENDLKKELIISGPGRISRSA